MQREHHKWHSPHLNKEMDILIFGTGGRPVLAFPTSMGRYYQNEDFSLIKTLTDHLDNGSLQIVCVDSVDEESWYDRTIPARERAERHNNFERYLIDEVIPWFAERNPRAREDLNVTGASFGAYHAANFGFKHPDLVKRILAMSGAYSLAFITRTEMDTEVYFNSPLDYLPNLNDDWYLSRMRQQEIILAVGSEDICRASTEQLSQVLWNKGVPNNLDVWGGAWHDWPWWKLMVLKYF
jgi:esterase/lipase superfamily enzyme